MVSTMGDYVDGDEKLLDQTSARLFEKSRIKVLQGTVYRAVIDSTTQLRQCY